MKKVVFFTLLISLVFFAFLLHTKQTKAETQTTFWQYQCIDTMKISRDKARAWADKSDLQNEIDWEMQTIADLGGNCVAIDTPYDDEFLPYLTKWVQSARQHHLHVWFRGNFSGWEQWFNYAKLDSTQTFLSKLQTFITTHPSFFADGDIFTGAPEAEDGGPFNQVEPDEYASYRKFLIDEYLTEQQAFITIGKQVQLNWFSMNGGLAWRSMDQETVDSLGGVVTIDHYIRTAPEMGAYISYFTNKFHAKEVVGEFGAPIPDINGTMSEDQQADFVKKLLQQLYEQKGNIVGINYWDLSDGSTAIMNPDRTPRKVAQVIKDYFSPVVISGTVIDQLGDALSGIVVKTKDGFSQTTTNDKGTYTLTALANPTTVQITSDNYNASSAAVASVSAGKSLKVNFVTSPQKPSILYLLRVFIKNAQ